MQKPNELNGVWQFLEDCGVLENGNADQIEAARKLYWKEYYRQSKRKQRRKKPEVNISFPEDMLIEIRKEAKLHNRPLSVFIRECALAYIKQRFVNPNAAQWEEVQQALFLTEIAIKQVAEEDEDSVNYHRNYNLLLEKLMELENKLNEVLNEPNVLEETIKQVVQQKPWYKSTLTSLINAL